VGVLLPYSPAQESEADHIGLLLMAKAGYDPHESVALWRRMEQVSGGSGQGPDFLSTHPNHGTRIANLESWMPQAVPYYQNHDLPLPATQ
jgi:predicted Zn-dependent protease